jgi:hypothetical protein
MLKGVEENINGDELPFETGAMFPNCLEVVFNGFGGLSVAFHVPGVRCDKGIRFLVGVSKAVFRDFEKDESNDKEDLCGVVHSKSMGDSADRTLE